MNALRLSRYVGRPEMYESAEQLAHLAIGVNNCACGVSHFGLELRRPDPDAPAGVVVQATCPITDATIDVYPDRRRGGR